LSVHVNLNTRRITPMPDELRHRVEMLRDKHQILAKPDAVGRKLGIRRKSD
jgi:acyl-CoA thioester hydrolase